MNEKNRLTLPTAFRRALWIIAGLAAAAAVLFLARLLLRPMMKKLEA